MEGGVPAQIFLIKMLTLHHFVHLYISLQKIIANKIPGTRIKVLLMFNWVFLKGEGKGEKTLTFIHL